MLYSYTDNTGKADYNMALLRRRTEAAADYLQKNYEPRSDRVVANRYGAENPIAGNETAEGRSENWRADVSIAGM